MNDQERKEDLIRLLEEAGFHENARETRTREGVPAHVYDTAKECLEYARQLRLIEEDKSLSDKQKVERMQTLVEEVNKKYMTFIAILEQGGFNN